MINLNDTARVLSVEGHTVQVRINGGSTCRKCGLAELGLCKAGANGMILSAENNKGAVVGDFVKLAYRKNVERKGFLFAYILPLLSFVLLAFVGHVIALSYSAEWIEVVLAFAGLVLAVVYSARKIKSLDKAEKLFVKTIVDEPKFCDSRQ